MQKVIDDAALANNVCSWLIKYVKAKHNLPNYDKAVTFTKSLNYIDHNADVTETGRLLFEFSQFNGDFSNCGPAYPNLDAPATPERVLKAVERVQHGL